MEPSIMHTAGFISLNTAYSFLAIVLVLGGLIFFHELGHFLAAKAFRVGVKTFSLGFGPRLAGFRKGDTEYQVAAFPLGGFVSMVGESDPADIPAPFSEKDSFALRPAWQRLVIIVAGPFFNLVLAWFLYWGVFYAQGQDFYLPQVGAVTADSPAMRAGLRPGDMILEINGAPIEQWGELVGAVMASEGAPLVLTVRRGTDLLMLTASPAPFTRTTIFGEEKTSWAIGLGPSGAKGMIRYGFVESAAQGARQGLMITRLIGESFVKMFERVVPLDSVGGPIRIAKEIHEQARSRSVAGIMMLAAFISLNLGLLNLLPIPVLDGGHIMFLLFEMVRRKPAPEGVQEISARIGVILLLCLMVFVTYNDISKWIQGKL